MPKEYPEYRETLEHLLNVFGREAIWVTSAELGRVEHADPRTVNRRYGIPSDVKGISITVLATRMCELARSGGKRH